MQPKIIIEGGNVEVFHMPNEALALLMLERATLTIKESMYQKMIQAQLPASAQHELKSLLKERQKAGLPN